MLEEDKKRDHRKRGKELQIYIIDDDVGPGLPLWLPRGAAIIDELEKLARETEFAAGYQRVRTPHIARESLYLRSGHLPYYAESMFPPMELDEHQRERAEWQKYKEGAEVGITRFIEDVLVRERKSTYADQLDFKQRWGEEAWEQFI